MCSWSRFLIRTVHALLIHICQSVLKKRASFIISLAWTLLYRIRALGQVLLFVQDIWLLAQVELDKWLLGISWGLQMNIVNHILISHSVLKTHARKRLCQTGLTFDRVNKIILKTFNFAQKFLQILMIF